MAIFITQGRYTSEAIKGMVANPENREKAVTELAEKAGGKLLALYFTFGHRGRSVWRGLSPVAMTAEHAMKAFKSAGKLSKSFKPARR